MKYISECSLLNSQINRFLRMDLSTVIHKNNRSLLITIVVDIAAFNGCNVEKFSTYPPLAPLPVDNFLIR